MADHEGSDLPLPRWLMEMAEDPLQHQHVAIVGDGWVTIRHPLIERRDFDLETCDLLQRVVLFTEQRRPVAGRYVVQEHEQAGLYLEQLS